MGNTDSIQKTEKIAAMQNELVKLIADVHVESNEKKKRKMIAQIGAYNRKIDKMKSGRILSREAKRDIVAYSFIAPNFLGFCIFTLIKLCFYTGVQ